MKRYSFKKTCVQINFTFWKQSRKHLKYNGYVSIHAAFCTPPDILFTCQRKATGKLCPIVAIKGHLA